MTTDDSDIVNDDERIVMVREIVEGDETVFYAIRDTYLDYWRSIHPFDDPAAWTRDRHQRAEFETRDDAEMEMACIHESRWEAQVESWEQSRREAA